MFIRDIQIASVKLVKDLVGFDTFCSSALAFVVFVVVVDDMFVIILSSSSSLLSLLLISKRKHTKQTTSIFLMTYLF